MTNKQPQSAWSRRARSAAQLLGALILLGCDPPRGSGDVWENCDASLQPWDLPYIPRILDGGSLAVSPDADTEAGGREPSSDASIVQPTANILLTSDLTRTQGASDLTPPVLTAYFTGPSRSDDLHPTEYSLDGCVVTDRSRFQLVNAGPLRVSSSTTSFAARPAYDNTYVGRPLESTVERSPVVRVCLDGSPAYPALSWVGALAPRLSVTKIGDPWAIVMGRDLSMTGAEAATFRWAPVVTTSKVLFSISPGEGAKYRIECWVDPGAGEFRFPVSVLREAVLLYVRLYGQTREIGLGLIEVGLANRSLVDLNGMPVAITTVSVSRLLGFSSI